MARTSEAISDKFTQPQYDQNLRVLPTRKHYKGLPMIIQQCVECLQLNAAATTARTTETLIANRCAKLHFHFVLYRYAA
jgi:hypothetical protein